MITQMNNHWVTQLESQRVQLERLWSSEKGKWVHRIDVLSQENDYLKSENERLQGENLRYQQNIKHLLEELGHLKMKHGLGSEMGSDNKIEEFFTKTLLKPFQFHRGGGGGASGGGVGGGSGSNPGSYISSSSGSSGNLQQQPSSPSGGLSQQ